MLRLNHDRRGQTVKFAAMFYNYTKEKQINERMSRIVKINALIFPSL